MLNEEARKAVSEKYVEMRSLPLRSRFPAPQQPSAQQKQQPNKTTNSPTPAAQQPMSLTALGKKTTWFFLGGCQGPNRGGENYQTKLNTVVLGGNKLNCSLPACVCSAGPSLTEIHVFDPTIGCGITKYTGKLTPGVPGL